MRWIIDRDIAVDSKQMQARRKYIECVTGAEVSNWNYIYMNGKAYKKYFICKSNDGLDGIFITAHVGDVEKLCFLKEICAGEFVVANTCIYERMSHKNILYNMMRFNRNIELLFAKQELSIGYDRILRQTTTVNNIGQFGFHTSLSERELFKNRKKGLMEAIQLSFVHVSPVILLGD